MSRWERGVRLTVLVLGVVVLGAACTSPPATSSATSTGISTDSLAAESTYSAAPQSSLVAPVPEDAVRGQYRGFFETLQRLGSPGVPDTATALAPYASGPAADKAVGVIATMLSNDERPGGTVVFSEIDVAIASTTATATECRDASTETIVKATTGEVILTGSPNTRYVVTLNESSSGKWLVYDYTVEIGGC